MKSNSKRGSLLITFLSLLLTYIIVKVVYKISGFYYNFDEGFGIKLVIDLALWVIVFLAIERILKWIFSK